MISFDLIWTNIPTLEMDKNATKTQNLKINIDLNFAIKKSTRNLKLNGKQN